MFEKKDTVLVEAIGARKQIGKFIFRPVDGYEYPVCEMPKDRAEAIINGDGLIEIAAKESLSMKNAALKEKGRKNLYKNDNQFVNFRYAISVKDKGKKAGI